jgi:hypothetical protein
MPRYTLVLKDDVTKEDLYLHWSSVIDAPITYALPLEAYREWYKREYGEQRLHEWDNGEGNRMSEEDALSWNRAGKNEMQIKTKYELLSLYSIK